MSPMGHRTNHSHHFQNSLEDLEAISCVELKYMNIPLPPVNALPAALSPFYQIIDINTMGQSGSKACFIRRILVASNAIETTDNEMINLIIYCLNCIRRDRNATFKTGLK